MKPQSEKEFFDHVYDTDGRKAVGQIYSLIGNRNRIYEEIDEELRTQYLLAYTSNSTRPSDEMREVEVKIERKGVDVRTIKGYYPGGF